MLKSVEVLKPENMPASENLNVSGAQQQGDNQRPAAIQRTASDVACEEAARRTADMIQEQANADPTDDDDDGVDFIDDEDDDDIPPAPPDGLYGWVICFVSFMCTLIVDGITNTFGIILVPLATHLKSETATISSAGSFSIGICLAAGTIVSALVHKFGCRVVCISGSILAGLSLICTAVSNSTFKLVLSYGILGGFGFAMIYLPTVIAVSHYFEQKRSLATAIASCGSGLGVLIFAPFSTKMVQQYGMETTLFTFSALLFLCCVFGALIVPLRYTKKIIQKPLLQRLYEEKQLQLQRGSFASSSIYTVQMADGTCRRKRKKPINGDPGVHSLINFDVLTLQSNSIHPVATLPTITEAKPIELAAANDETNGELIQTQAAAAGATAADTRRPPVRRPIRLLEPEVPQRVASFHSQDVAIDRVKARVRRTSWTERYQPSPLTVSNSNAEMNINSVEFSNADDTADASCTLSEQEESERIIQRPMQRKDIFYSSSITNLPHYKLHKSVSSYRSSILTVNKYEQSGHTLDPLMEANEMRDQYDLCPCLTLSDSTRNLIRNMLDMNILRQTNYLLIIIANTFAMAGLFVPVIYLPIMAKHNAINEKDAAYLLSIIGISKTIGQMFYGWLSDIPDMNVLLLTNICLFVSGLATILMPFCYHSFFANAMMSAFFGVAISGYISLTSMTLVALVGLDKLTNSFSVLMLFRGLGVMIGIPLASILIKNLNFIFFFAGGCFMLATIIGFSVQFFFKPIQTAVIEEDPFDVDDIDNNSDAENNGENVAESNGENVADDDDDQPITMLHKNNNSAENAENSPV